MWEKTKSTLFVLDNNGMFWALYFILNFLFFLLFDFHFSVLSYDISYNYGHMHYLYYSFTKERKNKNNAIEAYNKTCNYDYVS